MVFDEVVMPRQIAAIDMNDCNEQTQPENRTGATEAENAADEPDHTCCHRKVAALQEAPDSKIGRRRPGFKAFARLMPVI